MVHPSNVTSNLSSPPPLYQRACALEVKKSKPPREITPQTSGLWWEDHMNNFQLMNVNIAMKPRPQTHYTTTEPDLHSTDHE